MKQKHQISNEIGNDFYKGRVGVGRNLGFSYLSSETKMLVCDIILNAVWKSTREDLALAREREPPWYTGKGFKREQAMITLQEMAVFNSLYGS